VKWEGGFTYGQTTWYSPYQCGIVFVKFDTSTCNCYPTVTQLSSLVYKTNFCVTNEDIWLRAGVVLVWLVGRFKTTALRPLLFILNLLKLHPSTVYLMLKLLQLFQSLAVIWKWEMSLFYEFSTCHNLGHCLSCLWFM
jgi:hypothetical protein